jgi:glycosyltransferase involved in cell wall biosynthesis
LAESIASIVRQSFSNFEFIILDDASTDGTAEIARQWAAKDARIRFLQVGERLGPAGSSEYVVQQARYPLIARMDGDDVSHPERLRRQVEALDAVPEACLVGCLWEGIDAAGRLVRPRDRGRLGSRSHFAPFAHGSIMFRREAFERAGGYRREADFWEDLDLYRRLVPIGDILVIPDALYRHRASPASTRLTSEPDVVEAQVDGMYRQAFGIEAPARPTRRSRILPRVYVSLGSTRLWAGQRPHVLRRMLRRGELSASRATLLALGWALWGAVSPASLRFCLARAVAWRDRRISRSMADGALLRWSPEPPPGLPAPRS